MENQKFEQTKVVECILCNKWVIRKSGPKHLHTNHKKYMMNIPDPLYDELFQECNAVEEFHKISKITNFFDNKKMIIKEKPRGPVLECKYPLNTQYLECKTATQAHLTDIRHLVKNEKAREMLQKYIRRSKF